MIEGLQTFRDKDGNIVCVKCGWIAVDLLPELSITEAEIRGMSTQYFDGVTPLSYYDIALNGQVNLHIFRATLDGSGLHSGTFKPFFTEHYPC